MAAAADRATLIQVLTSSTRHNDVTITC